MHPNTTIKNRIEKEKINNNKRCWSVGERRNHYAMLV
jgi:hypothetical protein